MGSSPAQHETRTPVEAAVCEAMRRQNVPHEHGSLRFRVRMSSGETVEYRPGIVARRGPILFLVEALAAEDRTRTELLTCFLDQHSPEIVLVVLAATEDIAQIPPEAYDEIYDDADAAGIVRRIRLQDPAGIIKPFPKPRSGASL